MMTAWLLQFPDQKDNDPLKFLISTPEPVGSTKGNRVTAIRWSRLIRELGHDVKVTDRYDPKYSAHRADCLVALHAVRSSKTIIEFRKRHPDHPVIVCLTGTDIHLDLQGNRGLKNKNIAIRSLQLADQIVVLEPQCQKLLVRDFNKKSCVIFQSAIPVRIKPAPLKKSFEVTVLGHLRHEKDPLRTALAVRELPDSSQIQVKHLGSAYTKKYQRMAERESSTNPRYRWLGERSYRSTQRLLARSRLTVLTSFVEGAPSVISEAIVNGVPILATRITATIGLLGADYPGLFEVEDTARLTELLRLAESDSQFYRQLKSAVCKLKKRFHPDAEKLAWMKLIDTIS